MSTPHDHYGPNPSGYEYDLWGTYHKADRNAVGIDRTSSGTGYLSQYPAVLQHKYEDPATCPDLYLLFYHRLPYTFRMKDGRTLIQRIYDDHFEGLEETRLLAEQLLALAQSRLDQLKDQPLTMVFYESPLRLLKTLQQLADVMGSDREASVVREISKLHNTTHNGTLGELVEYFTANAPRGEIVIVVAGRAPEANVKVDKYAAFKGKQAKV